MKNKVQTIGYVISVFAFAFLVNKLLKLKLDLGDFSNTFKGLFWGCLLSLFIYIIADFLLGFGWSYMISSFSSEKGCLKKGICVYLKANIAKYIPGSVFQYVQRNVFLEHVQVSGVDAAVCSLAEIVSLLISGFCISLIFLRKRLFDILSTVIESERGMILLLLFLIVLLALLILIFRKKLAVSFKEIFSKQFLPRFLCELLLCFCALLLIALSFIPLANMVPQLELSFEMICFLLGALTCSWLSGYIIIGAPGGIGVKEFVFTLIVSVSPYCDILTLLLIIHRVISILGDIVCWICTIIARR